MTGAAGEVGGSEVGTPRVRILREVVGSRSWITGMVPEVEFADGRVSTDWEDFLRARGLALSENGMPVPRVD